MAEITPMRVEHQAVKELKLQKLMKNIYSDNYKFSIAIMA